uniref:Uncharacterized protein n=1 Tax=Euplotes crassus TaxID=5936 RepID=A0A7S3KEX6_EUPCR|mmetsp:Transcript_23987/g.23901  ORF Transcript_23987/g.23901 Transcript_23987/m.23901 type:complete len:231 (+) Transcript_23987:252-944(+)
MAASRGGSEALKKIYYGILKKFKAGNYMSGKMLTKIVKNCLVLANLDKISSISIPLLGTAGLAFPQRESIKYIQEGIYQYLKEINEEDNTIDLIQICVMEKDLLDDIRGYWRTDIKGSEDEKPVKGNKKSKGKLNLKKTVVDEDTTKKSQSKLTNSKFNSDSSSDSGAEEEKKEESPYSRGQNSQQFAAKDIAYKSEDDSDSDEAPKDTLVRGPHFLDKSSDESEDSDDI